MLKPGKYDPLKPDIELTDFKTKKSFGLKIDGQSGLQIGTISQDDTVHIRAAGKKVGDFDEQRSWKGGRGYDNLTENATGFWDSQDAWTMSDGHLHQGLLWQFGRRIKKAEFYLPSKNKSMTFVPVHGTYLYHSMKFTAGNTFSATYMRLWLKRVGQPGDLLVSLFSDSSGEPDSLLQSKLVPASAFPDVISKFHDVTFTGTQTITSGTSYHVVVFGTSTDTAQNHWEVGAYDGGATGLKSADGSTWIASDVNMYYYVSPADVNRRWFTFFLNEAMYVVDQKKDGTASQLWLNGDKGVVTSATSTTLVDSSKSFPDYAGAYIKIIAGKGIGQVRLIDSNTSTSVVVETWDITPDTSSVYIIYATDYFREITTTGLGVVSGQPIVASNIVYFPQGDSTFIRKMVYNSSTPGYSFSDDTNYAYLLTLLESPTKNYIVRGLLSTSSMSFAEAPAWAASPPALSFQTGKVVGGNTGQMLNLDSKDGYVWVFKTNGIWSLDKDFNIVTIKSGQNKTTSQYNGFASTVHQQFMYYSWFHTVIRVYGSSHDDIGQDWSSAGLPDGREGYFSSFDSYTSLLIGSVNAGFGTSSVLGFDGLGWHELYRAYDTKLPISRVTVQGCQGTRNRMWINVGDDFVFQEMPLFKSSPRLDSGMRYMHEAVIESAAIDMGTASGLPKFIKELTVLSKNLGNGNSIAVDYQVDDDVHTTNWTEASVLFESPESSVFFGLANVRKFAYRLRIMSSDNTLPVDVLGIIPNGYARVPFKMVWTLRCRADNIITSGKQAKPVELLKWLLDNARYPGRIQMTSQYELAHNYYVIVHPPRMFPYKPASAGQVEESIITISLEEA